MRALGPARGVLKRTSLLGPADELRKDLEEFEVEVAVAGGDDWGDSGAGAGTMAFWAGVGRGEVKRRE